MVDLSASFVVAIRARFPQIDVRPAVAEQLPFRDESFDLVCAQLVVHFMTDPVAGVMEMARVTRTAGLVAACVWDHAGGKGPLSAFWRAVRDLDPDERDESRLAGAREGDLVELFDAAGLHHIETTTLTVRVGFATFAGWWEPLTLLVGPTGAHVAQLDERQRDHLRVRCEQLLPPAPFEIHASAWCALGRAGTPS